MTLGTALVLITFILLTIAGVYFATKHKKWRLIGKIAGVVLLLGVLSGFGIWVWSKYQDRAQVVTGVGDISLGMTPMEVTLAIGNPDIIDLEGSEGDTSRRYIYLDYSKDIDYFVRFSNENGEYRATVICTNDYLRKILGFSRYDYESTVIKKLGEPTNVSVREDGLEKMISYKQWKASFGIEKGDIKTVCATESGEVKYLNEYGVTRAESDETEVHN